MSASSRLSERYEINSEGAPFGEWWLLTDVAISFVLFDDGLHVDEGFVEFFEDVVFGYEIPVLL